MSGNSAHTRQRQSFIVRAGTLVPPGAPPVEVSVTPLVLGRDESCDIVLRDPEVSAAHCEVLADPQGVRIRDLGSKNGTFIGSVRVREAYLTSPCSIVLGSTTILFEPGGKEHVPLGAEDRFGDLVGVSTAMRRLFRHLGEVAPTGLSVLITGETGTGKELVAKAIHENSPRHKGPFEVLDCTTIVGSLAESQLFGHEDGVFTGAKATDGAFQKAHRGTIFLDEIGELPLDLQPKLLRALAERRVKRIGATSYKDVDVRIIAATHQDVLSNTNTGSFRADLYFRLAQVRVHLPPLRDRREDIPAIARAVCARAGRPERADEIVRLLVSADLAQRDWHGNVRELAYLIQAIAELPPGAITIETVLQQAAPREPGSPSSPYSAAKRALLAAFDQKYFRDLHEATQGNISEMARRAGMERHHVRAHLRRLGIREDDD